MLSVVFEPSAGNSNPKVAGYVVARDLSDVADSVLQGLLAERVHAVARSSRSSGRRPEATRTRKRERL